MFNNDSKEIEKDSILEEDGVYIHKCDNTNCQYHDDRGFCLFETCVFKAIPNYHTTFMRKCAICSKVKDFGINSGLFGDICKDCLHKIAISIGENNGE